MKIPWDTTAKQQKFPETEPTPLSDLAAARLLKIILCCTSERLNPWTLYWRLSALQFFMARNRSKIQPEYLEREASVTLTSKEQERFF